MLNPTTTRIDELLVRLLASRPGMSASELHSEIVRKHRPCTIQGVNYELRKLQQSDVVMKHEGCFSLSLVWAAEFVGLADQVYDHYMSSIPEPWIIPDEGKKKSWSFSSIERANNLQLQMISMLLNATGEKRVFQWYPFPVLTLFRANQSMRLQKLLEMTEKVAYRIVGNRTPLSQDCLKRWNRRYVTYSDAVSSFERDRESHLSIVGDYVITLRMSKEYTATVEEIFRTYRTIGEVLTHGDFARLRERSSFKIVLEHNKRRSAELRRRFIEFFGISDRPG